MKSTVDLTFNNDAFPFTGVTAPFETEIVKANLELASYPNQVDFGEIKRTTFGGEKIYPIKTMSEDLVVIDERSAVNNNGWKVSATLEKMFTTKIDGTDYTLPNILKYKEGKNLKDLNQGIKVPIRNKYTDGNPSTNISKDWIKNEEGLVLQLFPGDAKHSSYSATILWELEDAY